ncbi:hypothetical protein EF847_10055 [Actinobacteria bacterium YIM 96077]|uniref:Peptidase M23 domain-containing protein n=1 Tax=Phytoactinopolyspora halophila TaxID=1981511 RepID=A0A329QLL9_9ACTN|nr:peptidoglycan DD-metalloendopeptidase family protein [Phytoactinopolyspora halophila]AYY12993.1 hypothetical protein EF847_10055 [Actinobacteria bacterium YIM 96077]RAW13257.1 hypothetical protein DPM12_13080 [Phytoactinopolyspora halophila]
MLKKALIGLAALFLLGPSLGILTIAVLMNPAGQAAGTGCLDLPRDDDPGFHDDAPIPDEALPWIATAAQTCQELPSVWIAAVMYQESSFNPAAFATDINGGTWGLLQINQHIWRSVYGPVSSDRNNNGLWDILEPDIHAEYGAIYLCDLLDDIRTTRQTHPEWPSTQELTELEALVVAHNAGPGRLATYPDIPQITRDYLNNIRQRMRDWPDLDHDDTDNADNGTDELDLERPQPHHGAVVFPLPDGTWRLTSPFGWRTDPTNPDSRELHPGVDLAAADGTPIYAIADGHVTRAETTSSGLGIITLIHTIRGDTIASVYMHMWDYGIHVRTGQHVQAGQHIGDVGSSGRSTGPHLHLEIRPGGPTADAVDPMPWLEQHGATHPDSDETADPGHCHPDVGGELPPAPQPFTGTPGGRIPDPTGTGGWVTRQLEHLIAETRRAFPNAGWSCWDQRPGSDSDHPRGRACDVTFGNAIGEHPTDAQRTEGWRMTTWLQTHANALWVDYLIWDGLIWSLNRADEGWRPYDGGGMHNPDDVTGGHHDHVHLSVR